jgi:hypothetical protein
MAAEGLDGSRIELAGATSKTARLLSQTGGDAANQALWGHFGCG